MDMILLQPGDPDILGRDPSDAPAWPSDSRPLDGGLDPTRSLELISISQGMKQQMTTDVSNNARTSGRPVISDFTCSKYVGQHSPRFYDCCLRARPLGVGALQPTFIYFLRSQGGMPTPTPVMVISLRDAVISEIQLQSEAVDMPIEQFKLNFTEILWRYTLDAHDGAISTGWSVMHNRPIGSFT